MCCFLSKGIMRFSTSQPGKTNEYVGTKLGRRDKVGKIYKLTKFGADRLRNGGEILRFCDFFVRHFSFFSVS